MDMVFQIFYDPVICYEFLNTLYSIVKLVPNFLRSAPYLQTGASQLQSGKHIPLGHEVESTYRYKLHAERCIFLRKIPFHKAESTFQ